MLILSGCATRYDARLVEQRTQELYGASEAPAPRAPDAQPLPSAEALFERADLELYLAFGLERSARLRTAFEAWRAAAERVEQASTLPDPQLSFGEFIEEVQTRTGPQRRRFGLSQAFPWPGKLGAKAQVATSHAEAAWQKVEQERLHVARRIEEAFHDYAFLGRELAITSELLELLQGLEPIVQGRIRGGAGQEDLLRLQVELGRLEDDVASITERRPSLSARLADAMNLPLRATAAVLPLPELSAPTRSSRDVAALVERALSVNPRLRVLEKTLEAARAAEELAEFERRPEFSARVEYIDTGDARSSGTQGSGDDPLFVGVSLSLPVWVSSYSAAEREARHSVRSARARLEAARSTLHADLNEEVYRVDDSQRRLELYRQSLIPRAREALQLTTVSYRAGSASVLDLLDSERALLEFELSYWRACRDYLQGEARLTELLGGAAQ
jgi:outer membrane protein TolC